MHLFHNTKASSLRKYLLVQAAVTGALLTFILGLTARGSTHGEPYETVFYFLPPFVTLGYSAYLIFPVLSSIYFIKKSKEKWIVYTVFGLIGLFASAISIEVLSGTPIFGYFGGGTSPVYIQYFSSVFSAVAISASSVLLLLPVSYLLGYYKQFADINFHLLLGLAMLLGGILGGSAAASVGDMLIEKETVGRVGLQHEGRCEAVVRSRCAVNPNGTFSAPDACQNYVSEFKSKLGSEGYNITKGENKITIGCPED
jgi:hypothetical protein